MMKAISCLLALAAACLLAACASYDGRGLLVGTSSIEEVVRLMGNPRQQWSDTDGSRHLAYPRGPMGVHTYMVLIDRGGKLRSIENVLEPKFFGRIETGMSQDQVLRILGPSEPSWTAYFPARDELVWEWRYCDDWNQLARFDVLFDNSSGLVRSTATLREDQTGNCRRGGCRCAR